MARLAFERVFSLDENSAEALAGLAAVELLAPEGTIERFVDLLTASYRLDPHSSPLNTALAQFHLVRGDVVAAEAYAQVAVRPLTSMLHRLHRSCASSASGQHCWACLACLQVVGILSVCTREWIGFFLRFPPACMRVWLVSLRISMKHETLCTLLSRCGLRSSENSRFRQHCCG